jgi:AsmA protein
MDTTAAPLPAARSPWPRRWALIGGSVAVLFALALTPPYLNVNRLQRRIASSMSEALGRPVHLDRVTLHLLPLPGFTLENLVVSEDPAFGAEPVIRANTVEITLRLSSIFRRQVEVSSIRFVEPSLNLVRNAEGRWNLQSLLMHAAAASGAPQPGAATVATTTKAPAFPYIEATGARVNVKLGDEKKPFSLTETDFALWLPDPSGWRVRLEGKPARTDLNISDPGTIKLEGSLQRAAAMADVPVNLTASWEGAPLGEASLLLSGADAGFRGKLTVNATLSGKLGAASLSARAHLEELRRADFVPAHTLELTTDCAGTLDITTAVVTAPVCKLIAPASKTVLGTAVSESVDLSHLTQLDALTGLRFGTPGMAESWLLDAARLFSQRIPASAKAEGQLAGSFVLTPGEDGGTFWQGALHAETAPIPGLAAGAGSAAPRSTAPPATDAARTQPELLLDGTPAGLVLEPYDLLPSTGQTLLLSGLVTDKGYTLHLAGAATAAQLTMLFRAMPPFAEGLPTGLVAASTEAKPAHIDLTCTRTWHGPQTCTEAVAPEPVRKRRRR